MSRVRTGLLAAAALLGIGAVRPPQPPIAYVMSPELHDGQLIALDISLQLRAGPGGRARLQLPNESAGGSEFWRNIRDLKVEGAKSVSEPSPAERLIEAAPGSPLTVRYRLVSAFDHDPDVTELDTYKPLIRPRRFWIYGETALVRPKDWKTVATFRWIGAPPGFGFASNLEHAHGKPVPLQDVLQTVAVGGPDLVVRSRNLSGSTLRVAILGPFDFPPDTFVDAAARVIAGERAFWGRREGPFLVTLAALRRVPTSISIRGEGRGDAFAIQTGSNTPLDNIRVILAQEYFHTWNPRRLGGARGNTTDRLDYWFSEGFTDFYARRLALRAQVIDLRSFVKAWNGALREYAASPVRTAPNARILADFWKNSEVGQLPYERGSMLAAKWDRELRDASHDRIGLDDIMRAMRDSAASRRRNAPSAVALFVQTAARFGLDVRGDVDRAVERGQAILLPPDTFGGCLVVSTQEVPRFDSGYAVATRDGKLVIVKAPPDGPAYAAGIREGMAYVHRDAGEPGDPLTPYKVRINEGETERVVTYLPQGEGMETLQQVVVPKDLTPAAQAACARTVANAR
jgi:predicted metalloprotease with PDZ domain